MTRVETSAWRRLVLAAFLGLAVSTAPSGAQMHHDHKAKDGCDDAILACASKATPTFAPDGTLWVVFATASRTAVVRSQDLGRTFSDPVAVHRDPLSLDWGPDARPQIAVDAKGHIFVAFNIFRDKAFNGEIFYSRSTDGGRSFAAARPITDNRESQRFQAIALDADGSVFAAWLDKRNRAPAAARGEKYVGAALAFAWSHDQGATYSPARLAQDNTCECCRLAVAFAGPGRPVIAFRNVFDKTVRDHAVVSFENPRTPGPVRRVSIDNWKTDACPHQGPSLAIGPDGTYHVAWFANGSARRGLFYAYSTDQGRSFSEPMAIAPGRNASRPSVLAAGDTVWLAWKEFDGKQTKTMTMASHDGGRRFGEPRAAAQTSQTSDHPMLLTDGRQVFLSWLTLRDGYKFLALEDIR